MFQSTRPRGARQYISPWVLSWSCFNPRAHAGRDTKSGLLTSRPEFVSIHAPTRGATTSPAGKTSPAGFQSTRPRGARQ